MILPRLAGILLLTLLLAPTLQGQAGALPTVYLIGTGGTIADGIDPLTGNERLLSAGQLVDLAPSLDDDARVEAEDFTRIGSPSMTPELQFRLAERVRELFRTRPDLAGIVITHGTDALEETAFMVDLLYDDPRPVVFTAALRPPRLSDSDAPRNLESAVRTAIAPGARGMGVLVALNNAVQSARYVTKGHSIAIESFQSGSKGIVARIDGERVIFFSTPLNRVRIPALRVETEVDLVRLASGDTGKFIRYSAESGARGLVIEAFGRGTMPRPVIDAVAAAVTAGERVVIVSRTAEGRVEVSDRLARAGVIEGEDLDGLKARIVLMLALGAEMTRDQIQGVFRRIGGVP